jgi:cell division protein FtsB
MQNRSGKKAASWLTGIVLALGIGLLGVIFFALIKETHRKRQVLDEIKQLQDEAARIEKENSEIKEKLAYFDSRDFKEKEAKDKLNLQDPGENLLVIKPSLSKEATLETEENRTETRQEAAKLSNLKKWMDYFFKY